MLSRVAETIYWIGRYLERAENTARLINVNTNLMMDLPKGIDLVWQPLIHMLGCEIGYAERHDEITERRVVNFLITDESNTGSILSTLAQARENARTIREILPREAWEELNALYQVAHDTKQNSYSRHGRHEYLLMIIGRLQQHTGLMAGTMNHSTAYSFLNLGRKIERADMTTRMVNVKSENPISDEVTDLRPFQDMIWLSILESLGAYQMYRQSMQTRINRMDVLVFLFRKGEFPRSLAYCTENISYNLSCLPNNGTAMDILQKFEKMILKTSLNNMDNIILHDFVDRLQICLGDLHESIATAYFPNLIEQEQKQKA